MITKLAWLNQTGIQTMATTLYKSINTRIRERIATAITDGTSGTVNTRQDDNHTLSAKVILGVTDAIETAIGASSDATTASTVYGYINAQKKDTDDKIGETTDTSTDSTVYGYINGQVADINDAIGESTDTAADATVYGYINGEVARLEGVIGGLTHLTYQKVDGPISGVTNPQTDVIYLQHDLPSIWVANDGYVMHDANTRASYTTTDAEPETYYAYYDESQEKFFKALNNSGTWTVTETELQDSDPIFSDPTTGAATVADNTYNLYIYRQIPNTEPAQYEWLCVGDTALELDNYWSKTDADVLELRSLMMEAISTNDINSAVQAAFNATDPYAGSSSYIWDT